MDNTETFEDIDKKLKEEEIMRLTGLGKEKSKSRIGRILNENRRTPEPKKGILTDDEILKYAGDTMAASKIRIKRGEGTLEDKFTVMPIFALIGLMGIIFPMSIIPISFMTSDIFGVIIGILLFLGCVGSSYYFYFKKDFTEDKYKNTQSNSKNETYETQSNDYRTKSFNSSVTPSFEIYEKKSKDLEKLYQIKEKTVLEVLGKNFKESSITYERFSSIVENCKMLFYEHIQKIFTIIELSDENNPKINNQLENEIQILKIIIEKLDELTNELVLNLSSTNNDLEDDEELNNLLDDLKELIDSVKDYK